MNDTLTVRQLIEELQKLESVSPGIMNRWIYTKPAKLAHGGMEPAIPAKLPRLYTANGVLI